MLRSLYQSPRHRFRILYPDRECNIGCNERFVAIWRARHCRKTDPAGAHPALFLYACWAFASCYGSPRCLLKVAWQLEIKCCTCRQCSTRKHL
ncbi:hypothetical protein U0070_014391 [Myodes glareolus]|uniref:Uncharacterized protein n=1 Tax=Myodes glareolus TaxID=447135 RepID=A0AAW0J6Z9_MYOGA